MKEELLWKTLESTVKYLTYKGSLKQFRDESCFEEVKFKYRGLVWEQKQVENNSDKKDISELKTNGEIYV